MILVCGGLADGVTELVCARLESMQYDYHLLNLGLYPEGYSIAWTWDKGVPSGTIDGPEWSVDLTAMSGVFVRHVGKEEHAPITSIPSELMDATLVECASGVAALMETLPCRVVNRMRSSTSNNSKPYQGLLVRQGGLRTPRTLITSDPTAARAFYDECAGQVIFKSLSGVRSIVRRMEPEDVQRLHLLRNGVAQFQEYIPGDNIRVHTVGDRLFATRIRSEAVDYRYAHLQGASTHMEPAELPASVAQACRQLTEVTNLLLAGIDLKETRQGEWYCFEINPAPGFSFVELRTGQPISAALAELLRNG